MNDKFTQQLPIAAVATNVCDQLRTGNVVLQAEPGAGKSTGLPLALLSSGIKGKILLLEPRRLAAVNVASRLASQLGESVGDTVGLRMRGSTKVSDNTRLEVVTEGVLTRILQHDPLLDGVSMVIFDEFHERSLHADLGLALSLDVQNNLREDLRLLLMSATLDGVELCRHVGVDVPVVCTVRQHPVDIIWCGESRDAPEHAVSRVTLQAIAEHDGDALVFLPGIAEIEKTANLLTPRLPDGVVLHRLHGRAPIQEQRAATAASGKQRRVILSTSIAETSITIDGVRIVVDSGVERRARIDNASGAERLETVMASQASATQRAGRAGRTQAGVCYRLWSEEGHGRRAARWQPELFRADLSPVLVELAQWGTTDVSALPWVDVPHAGACQRARQLLRQLGVWKAGNAPAVIPSRSQTAENTANTTDAYRAGSGQSAADSEQGITVQDSIERDSTARDSTERGITEQGLTEHGRAVARLPLHPRLGHMLLWANNHGTGMAACQLAALLEERPTQRGADLSGALKPSARAKQLFQLLPKRTGKNISDTNSVGPSAAVLLAQAYPDRIGRRRKGVDARYQLSSGAGALLHNEDTLAQSQWLVAASLGGTGGGRGVAGGGSEARIFSALPVDIKELRQWCDNLIDIHESVEWDDKAERVVAERQSSLGAIVLESKPVNNVNPEQRAAALMQAVRYRGLDSLNMTDDVREWQARVGRMRALEGEGSDYPAVDDDSLLADVSQWLSPWIENRGTLKALQQIDMMGVLSSQLTYEQQQKLDQWFPTHYRVPSGSKYKLRYACDGNPVLAVKLQEMFGCRQNPVIAGGRVNLKIELLSPARRPVQITEDLANFWHNSYAEVKKDLAGRYPKHPWPDDPLNAEATARAKPRKK